jgi:anthranilate phosphoribosyltransferase
MPRSAFELSAALTLQEARAFMEACLDPDSDPAEVGRALLAYNDRPLQGTELTAFAQVLGERARPFHAGVRPLLDTCGTGGDARQGVHTANLSTLAALVLARMGVDIVKHGSRAASSRCGSADLLEALGLDLDRPQEQVEADLGRTHFAFLFAQRYHPVLGRMAPIRRALAVPTVFNMLGPLLNPARRTSRCWAWPGKNGWSRWPRPWLPAVCAARWWCMASPPRGWAWTRPPWKAPPCCSRCVKASCCRGCGCCRRRPGWPGCRRHG